MQCFDRVGLVFTSKGKTRGGSWRCKLSNNVNETWQRPEFTGRSNRSSGSAVQLAMSSVQRIMG